MEQVITNCDETPKLNAIVKTETVVTDSTTPTGLVSYSLVFKDNNRLIYINLDQTEYRDYTGSYVSAILKKELPHVINLRANIDPFAHAYVDVFDGIENWCENNCSGLWMCRSKTEFLFQNYSDAVAVKLRINGQEFVNEER